MYFRHRYMKYGHRALVIPWSTSFGSYVHWALLSNAKREADGPVLRVVEEYVQNLKIKCAWARISGI